ncbi:MAG: hypothetical protein U0414_31295 [Polyangiaceae bacterium]
MEWMAVFIAGAITLTVVVQVVVSKRRARALVPADDAVAECWAVPAKPFELPIPASGALELILTMHADGEGRKHGIRWGFTASLTADRPVDGGGYRGGAEPFHLAVDAHAGPAQSRTKSGLPRVPAQVLDGDVTNTNANVKVLLAKIPAGGPFVLKGTVETAGSATVTSVWIAAHAAKS